MRSQKKFRFRLLLVLVVAIFWTNAFHTHPHRILKTSITNRFLQSTARSVTIAPKLSKRLEKRLRLRQNQTITTNATATTVTTTTQQSTLLFQEIESSFSSYPKNERELIRKACCFIIDEDHDNRLLKHACGVAQTIVELKLDVDSILAGILLLVFNKESTDTNESATSTYFTERQILDRIENHFGSDIRSLVERTQKLDRIIPYHHAKHEKEKYQKLLVGLAQGDIRIILIKLAHQMQTTRSLERQQQQLLNLTNVTKNTISSSSDIKQQQQQQESSQERFARESLDIYSPLAHRLGVYTLKTELEDMSLYLWKPKIYQELETLVSTRQEECQLYTDQVIGIINRVLTEGGMMTTTMMATGEDDTNNHQSPSIIVSGRAKSYYSIYQKMQQQSKAFGDIQDLLAFRILVNDVTQCYQALGIIHERWKPLKGRFKDYIVQPKFNGYKSLHTTVVGHEGKRMEVQIRTHEFHEIAESGIAAHWLYKKGKSNNNNSKGIVDAQRYQWLRQLVECIQTDGTTKEEEVDQESMEKEIFGKDVFVFSPQGNLFGLNVGSSVLDFAYSVHSELGNHCVGAKVNGRMVPLKYRLENGDTIEIMKSSTQRPRKEWLQCVKTSKAKARIKAWLKRQQLGDESAGHGQEILETALKKYASRKKDGISHDGLVEYKDKLEHLLSEFHLKDEEHLFESIAFGQVTTRSILNVIFDSSSSLIKSHHQTLVLDEENDEIVIKPSTKGDNTAASAQSETRSDGGVVIGGERNMLISFCRNCNPLHGEDVQGVITQGRGVKIHRSDCKYLHESIEARRIDAVWDDAIKARPRPTLVEVICEDSSSVFASLSKAISSSGVNIHSAVLKKVSNGRSLVRFELMLRSKDELNRVMQQLHQEPEVISLRRK